MIGRAGSRRSEAEEGEVVGPGRVAAAGAGEVVDPGRVVEAGAGDVPVAPAGRSGREADERSVVMSSARDLICLSIATRRRSMSWTFSGRGATWPVTLATSSTRRRSGSSSDEEVGAAW